MRHTISKFAADGAPAITIALFAMVSVVFCDDGDPGSDSRQTTMKRISRWTLVVLATALSACGGGGDSGSGGSGGSTPVTASSEGIFTGSMTSTVSHRAQTVTAIVLPTGEARLIRGDCVQYIAATTMSGSFFSGSGTAYAPDGSIAACPSAITFPNGTSLASLDISGQATTASNLLGTYSGGGDSGTFTVSYNNAYTRAGTIARIRGNYSNGTVSITIDDNGIVTGTLGADVLNGQVSTIDVSKNAYRISVTETKVTAAATDTASATSATVASWGGLATLLDYASGTDNYLVLSLTNASSGFAVPLVRQ